jgi:putative ABC transport system ATP-binding protein
MRRLNREQKTTFVFSSHDPMVIAYARRVIRLRDGRLESDSRQDLQPAEQAP